MRLAHLHLPSLTHYAHASAIQQHLVSLLLASKAAQSGQHPSHTQSSPPDPLILTAQFHPVYTTGRRELGTLTPWRIAHLRSNGAQTAEFHEALRGGQTTYHGPGQLVAYPIIDLLRHGLRARDYVHLLEETVVKTCARYGVKGFRTENPGVWVSEERKICAVGVHLRRNVTSHGVGLNVGMEPMGWFERITACGLEGKEATCLEREGDGLEGLSVEEVGRVFVEEFVRELGGVEEVYSLTEGDLGLRAED
jgi:lipoyl(octanoyl) transferase 2